MRRVAGDRRRLDRFSVPTIPRPRNRLADIWLCRDLMGVDVMPRVKTAGRAAVVIGIASLTVVVFLGSAWAGSLKSKAWAGYQAGGERFQRVAASWKVPTVASAGVAARGDSDSYVWVGLGSGASNSERVRCPNSVREPSKPTWLLLR